MKRRWLISLVCICALVSLTGQRCTFLTPTQQAALQPISLDMWRVTDTPDDFGPIVAAYQAVHPNISINIRIIRLEEYEQEFLNALAEDRSPDIISLHNTWVKKYESKIAPLPPQINNAYITYKKSFFKTERIVDIRSERTLTLKQLRERFADVVDDDVVISDQIYGLPMSVDSLAMFYNKDLLNQAGVPLPPKNWNEFQAAVKAVTKRGAGNDILIAGTAMGTASNVERPADLVSVLMMQNGAEMVNAANRPTFNQLPRGLEGRSITPGAGALQFYIDFALPNKEVYTWNSQEPMALQAFYQGNVAFIFGYSWHLPLIRAQAPRLNFAIAPLPQIVETAPVNYASYWVESVPKKSNNQGEAWDFIQFATREQNVKSYLDQTNKPTALLNLIAAQRESADLDSFSQQVLTAKSWYRGNDAKAVDTIFKDMIDQALLAKELNAVVSAAVSKINQTY